MATTKVDQEELRAEVEKRLPSLQIQDGDALLTQAATEAQDAHRASGSPNADMISWQDIGHWKDGLIAKAQPILCTAGNEKILDDTLDVANAASVATLLLPQFGLPMKVVITLSAALIRMGAHAVCANYKPATAGSGGAATPA